MCLEVTYFYARFYEPPHVTFANQKEPQKYSILSEVQVQNPF